MCCSWCANCVSVPTAKYLHQKRWALSSTCACYSDCSSLLAQNTCPTVKSEVTMLPTLILSFILSTLESSPSSSLLCSSSLVSSMSSSNTVFILHCFWTAVFQFFYSALLCFISPDQVCIFSYWEFVVSLHCMLKWFIIW